MRYTELNEYKKDYKKIFEKALARATEEILRMSTEEKIAVITSARKRVDDFKRNR